MRNFPGIGLIVVLSVVAIVTISLTFGHKIGEAGKSEGENDGVTNMNFLVKNDLQKYGVEVISSAQPDFDTELRRYVGGDDELLALVASAKPFVLFVRNHSSKEVVGVSLRWKFTDPNGANFEIPQNEANPGVLMGIKPLDPKMIGKTSLINSRDTRFFTYFTDIVGHRVAFANMRIKNPSVNHQKPFRSAGEWFDISSLSSMKEKLLADYSDSLVLIDGIVFNDGTFVGPDRNLFFDTLSGEIEARKEVLKALAKAESSGKSKANILDSILSNTSSDTVDRVGLSTDAMTREQAFNFSYNRYVNNLRRELSMKRLKMSDDYILQQLRFSQLSDFVPLRRIGDATR